MKRTTLITLAIGSILLVAALFTIGNKRWWIKRIQAKWVTTRWVWQSDLMRWELVVDGYDTGNLSRYSLAELVKDYSVGMAGWTKPGDPTPPMPATPSAVGEGQFITE